VCVVSEASGRELLRRRPVTNEGVGNFRGDNKVRINAPVHADAVQTAFNDDRTVGAVLYQHQICCCCVSICTFVLIHNVN
jgi:hypothetical protein